MSSWIRKLHQAVMEDHLPSLRRHLKKVSGSGDGVHQQRLQDIQEWSLDRGCPLQAAAHLGYNEMVRLLVAAGIDVNSYSVDKMIRGSRYTALHCAAVADEVSTVKILLELGADPELLGWKNSHCAATALDFAIEKGNWGVVEVLRRHTGQCTF